MKNVLFVSDYFTHGGLETRILELIDFYKRHGITSFLTCDTIAPEHEDQFKRVLKLPFCTTDSETIIQNTDTLIAFCRDNKIDMIDCQPLYGFVPAVLASSVLHLPVSYTAHSLFTFPPANNSMNPLFYSLLELKHPQIFAVADYLLDVYKDKFEGYKIDIARNGVFLSNLPKLKIGHVNKWAYAARLSPEKTKPLISSLPIIEKAGIAELDVFGDGAYRPELEKYILEHPQSKLKINLRGWCKNLQEQLATGEYTGFLGIDRAAIEAMAIGLPVMILGLNGIGPAINTQTFKGLLPLNMSSDETMSTEQVCRNVANIQTNPQDYDMRVIVAEYFDAEKLWAEYLETVRQIQVDLGRDNMIEFWWERFYESVLLEKAASDNREQINHLTQRVYELENTLPRKLVRKIRNNTNKN